jgi:uncharacterized glyoxalase superfamily protein PhnB
MAIPKLNAVLLYVASTEMLRACVQWYLKLGLELSSSEEPEESAFFNTGNGALFAIHTAKTVGHSEAGVYFEVENVELLYQKLLQEGFVFDNPPARQPWGYVCAWLRDPAGHQIALVTPY